MEEKQEFYTTAYLPQYTMITKDEEEQIERFIQALKKRFLEVN